MTHWNAGILWEAMHGEYTGSRRKSSRERHVSWSHQRFVPGDFRQLLALLGGMSDRRRIEHCSPRVLGQRLGSHR